MKNQLSSSSLLNAKDDELNDELSNSTINSIMLTFSHVYLLIKKNFIIKIRSFKSSALEFIIPLIAILILMLIRTLTPIQYVESSLNLNYETPVESTIIFPLMSLLCGGYLSTNFNSEIQVPFNRIGFVNKVKDNNFIDLFKFKLKKSLLNSTYIHYSEFGYFCPQNQKFISNEFVSEFINFNMVFTYCYRFFNIRLKTSKLKMNY